MRGNDKKPKSALLPMPLLCVHRLDYSEIVAQVGTKGNQAIIGTVLNSKFVNAKSVSEFLVRAANRFERNEGYIQQAISALELCLATNRLTWEAENEADLAVRRVKEAT